MRARDIKPSRGAALLLAMIVLTLVATVAAGMVYQQQRAVHVEAAERARTQAYWMLDSGIDFGRYVIRRFSNTKPKEGAPWDTDLQETRLSSLLAADRDNNADGGLEAFISGRVEDAQSRYNLRNVLDNDGKEIELEVQTLQRICELAGTPGLVPTLLAALKAMRTAPVNGPVLDSTVANSYPLTRMEHLRWLGVDAVTLERLMRYADLLPDAGTKLNINTASAEVIQAVGNKPAGVAAQLQRVGAVASSRFNSVGEANSTLGLVDEAALPEARFDHTSSYFYIHATVRFEDRALTARALVKQEGSGSNANIRLLRLERGPAVVPSSNTAATGSRP